jgi:hypothetical protein
MGRKFRKSSVDVIDGGCLGTSTGAAEVPEQWGSGKKAEVALRLLRGEDVGTVSHRAGMEAHGLGDRRRVFIEGGKSGLKSRSEPNAERELTCTQASLGELMMEMELTEGLLRKEGFRDDLRKLGP